MPTVKQSIDICCIAPISTTINKDVDGCISDTTSDYGYVTVDVNLNRDINGNISPTYNISDAVI